MTGFQDVEPPPTSKLYRIVEEIMCIGCGICQSIAGPEVLRLQKSRSGFLHPVGGGELSDAIAEKILDICPSRHLESLPPHLVASEGRTIPDTIGLRIEERAREMGADLIEAQKAAARQRIRDGKARKPRPVA